MKIYVRDYNCNRKYFDTLDDAVRYLRRYSKPCGASRAIFVQDDAGVHIYGTFRKDADGKFMMSYRGDECI